MKLSLTKLKTIVSIAAAALVFVTTAQATNPGGGTVNNKMIIGDSIFALSGDIHEYLEADLDEVIDTYARSGCQMNGGNLICSSYYSIPRQYSRASKSGITTVIMNGGGNDFLIGDGCGLVVTLSSCMETLLAIEETIENLTNQMKADGMQKIVFLGYYNAPGEPDLHVVNEYSMNYKAANYPAMGITFVETRYAFEGNEWRYVTSDGIHPTAAGSRVLADLILQVL